MTAVDLSAESKLNLKGKFKDVVLDIDKLCGLTFAERESLASIQTSIKTLVASERNIEKSEASLGKVDQLLNQMLETVDEIDVDLNGIVEMTTTFGIIERNGGKPSQ